MPLDTTTADPVASRMIAKYIREHTASHGRPVPLIATRIGVDIADGVAVVTTDRVFRNGEPSSIEATITFPVPVHATLASLTYQIDGRTVAASAQRKAQARETYEGALDRGKSAALHEELLRGVHMLSVGHVPAGKEVTVTSVWALPLAAAGDAALLRIPTTVGDIFGTSPLPDSDDLVHDSGVRHTAELTVACRDGAAHLAGGGLKDGKATVALDHPLDILVAGFSGGVARGTAADGRSVILRITRDVPGDGSVNGVVLADMSGSMANPASFDSEYCGKSKYCVMVEGLRDAAGSLRDGDRVDLIEFDHLPHRREAPSFRDAVLLMRGTNGSTEIGLAISEALAGRETDDVLLVTDGKSYALNVQEAARSGRRFTVVLVGEDSLDANVGHLAALTGGQIFVASGVTSTAIRQAFESMRRPHARAEAITGLPVRAAARIGGMAIEAVWGKPDDAHVVGIIIPTMITDQSAGVPALAGDSAEPPTLEGKLVPAGQEAEGASGRGRIIGALAASLAIPLMEENEAAAFAEAHGIVCHLTSLVLVDEAGETQDGIPAQRKVPLMTPRSVSLSAASFAPSGFASANIASASFAPRSFGGAVRGYAAPGNFGGGMKAALDSGRFGGAKGLSGAPMPGNAVWSKGDFGLLGDGPGPSLPQAPAPFDPFFPPSTPPVPPVRPAGQQSAGAASLRTVTGRIDWSSDPERLRRGDIGALPADVQAALRYAASLAEIVALASELGLTAIAVAVALVARAESYRNRNAARLARAAFNAAGAGKLDAAARATGL
jgi:hypothetical protein